MFLHRIIAVCVAFVSVYSLAHAEPVWSGPTEGPRAIPGKHIAFISHGTHNGGITGAFRGFEAAARELGWQVTLFDGKANPQVIRAKWLEALQSHVNAIVIGGFEVADYADLVLKSRQAGVELAGWHAANAPGPTKDLIVNVATRTEDVAAMAANYAIEHSEGNVGVVIFTDTRFGIAVRKDHVMQDTLSKCSRCKVLEVINLPLENANRDMPNLVKRLNTQYEYRWTHSLGINDVYFDSINIPLMALHRSDIENISAGDGSNVALGRIMSGRSQQVATIAEPIEQQGWQIADELNRSFAGKKPTGYVSRPVLIATEVLRQVGSIDFEASVPFKQAYRAIWH